MPTLNWIGKEAVVNHDKEVPFRLLRKVKSASRIGNSKFSLTITACSGASPSYQFNHWLVSKRSLLLV